MSEITMPRNKIVQSWLDGQLDAGGCIAALERELAAERERADKARREGWEAGMREAADVLEKQARRVEAHGWFANAGTLRACAALLLLAIEEKKK